MSNRTKELVNTVRTRKVVGHGDYGDNWDIPIYNTPERLEAAEELANALATEALPALQDFFIEGVQTLNLRYDADEKGFHHFTYPSELRRLVKALVLLGGAGAFSRMMMGKVLPALEKKAKETETLAFLRREFGSIGDWEGEVAKKRADEEKKRGEEEAMQRAERDRIRKQEEAKRRAEEERRLGIQERRKTQGQCVMCGRRLAFFDRLLKREKHSGCRSFAE